MANGTMALVIAPRHQILRDFKKNKNPIVVALAALVIYIIVSSSVICVMERWSFLHAAYFTVINVTTVGFGDVVAATHSGKVLSGVNAFAGLIAFGVLVALITLAFQPGEFTGTAAPVEQGTAQPRPPGSVPNDAPSGTAAAAGLLESLGHVLRLAREPAEGNARIAVHTHLNGAHVLIEIFVREGHDA